MEHVDVTTEERNWGMGAHLSALIAAAGLPFGHIVGPLVVQLVKGSHSPFVAGHAKASLNYQLTASIAVIGAMVVAAVAFFIYAVSPAGQSHAKAAVDAFGLTLMVLSLCLVVAVLALFVLSLVWIIMGTIAASEGRPYTYPFAIRFVR